MWSQNVLIWWAEGEGAEELAVYSLFGQLMLLKEAECTASMGCHLTTVKSNPFPAESSII